MKKATFSMKIAMLKGNYKFVNPPGCRPPEANPSFLLKHGCGKLSSQGKAKSFSGKPSLRFKNPASLRGKQKALGNPFSYKGVL